MNVYKQMYLILLDATEKAINQIVSAQRACEELYISSDDKNVENIKLHKIKLDYKDE